MADPRDLIQRLADFVDASPLEGALALAAEARAYLATPEPVARPTDEGLIRTYQAAYEPAWKRGEHYGCHIDGLRAVLTRWGNQPPQPIPLSERLPGLEDCIDEGWCWFYTPRGDWVKAVLPVSPAYTHWLAHHVLPLPEVEP